MYLSVCMCVCVSDTNDKINKCLCRLYIYNDDDNGIKQKNKKNQHNFIIHKVFSLPKKMKNFCLIMENGENISICRLHTHYVNYKKRKKGLHEKKHV